MIVEESMAIKIIQHKLQKGLEQHIATNRKSSV